MVAIGTGECAGKIESLQSNNNWNELGIILGEKSKQLSDFGADYIAICTNTMHKLVDQISIFTDTPILHISDAVGQSINNSKLKNILLLGTKFTMKQDFYKKILIEKYNLNITIPNEEEMNNLKDLTNLFLVFAEDEAKQRHVMTMKDWIDATDDLLKFRRKEVLNNSGSISHKEAVEKAEKEYEKFRIIQDQKYISSMDEFYNKYLNCVIANSIIKKH